MNLVRTTNFLPFAYNEAVSRAPADGHPARTDLDEALAGVERSLIGITRLAQPSRIFGERIDASGEPLDWAPYSVLARIEQFGPIRLTDLAAAMEIDISTASRHVRALEDRQLVLRHCDPNDLRARRLDLTEAGIAVLRQAHTARLAAIRERLAVWSPTDVAELARLLERLLESFAGANPSSDLGASTPLTTTTTP
jgi:DNA-binding MarR family transcriptional regulator